MRGFIIIIVLLLFSVPASFALSMPPRTAALPEPAYATPSRASARPTPPVSTSARDQSLLARVTVYWASGGEGSDRYTRCHKTATGARLRNGHCAVDPRHIPYGSKVVLPDGSNLAAVDTGTAVKNRKAARKAGRTVSERNAMVVDRFFETKGQALAWANTHPLFMPVRVVAPNYRPTQQSQQSQTLNSPPATSSTIACNAPAPTMKPQPIAASTLLASNTAVTRSSLNRMGR